MCVFLFPVQKRLTKKRYQPELFEFGQVIKRNMLFRSQNIMYFFQQTRKEKKRLLRFLRYMFCWGFRPDSAHLSIPSVHSVTVYKHENRWLCTFRELSTCTATTLISSLNFTSFSNSEAAWREKGKCHVTFLWCTATWGLFNKRNVQGFKITLA